MNLIEICILIFIIQISSFLMILFGMNVKERNNKKINLNPIEAIKEKKKEQDKKEEYKLIQKQKQIMLENINNYNGTPLGQKDIPTNN